MNTRLKDAISACIPVMAVVKRLDFKVGKIIVLSEKIPPDRVLLALPGNPRAICCSESLEKVDNSPLEGRTAEVAIAIYTGGGCLLSDPLLNTPNIPLRDKNSPFREFWRNSIDLYERIEQGSL